MLRAAASVHAEILTVVLSAACHQQTVEQRSLRNSQIAVTYRERAEIIFGKREYSICLVREVSLPIYQSS